ncbi:MAG: right-handed parallel beta-helix repeat-containing protein [Deltaproteobacteria bacterium]|nr:right-handed parallel beta-helix repeat-containing protein [Deltaproteobacteria bacterium]
MRKSIFMVLLGLLLAVPAFAVNSKPVRELIVSNAATGDGEYSTITAALAATDGSTPCIIKVMPGTYTESTITMKSNVHLQGSGREVTTLDLQGGTIYMNNTNSSSITGITILMGRDGINCTNCGKATISNNSIIGPGVSLLGNGAILVYNNTNGSVVISDNIITEYAYGVDMASNAGYVTVRENIIKGNQFGIYMGGSSQSTYITGNEIINNTYGVRGGYTNLYVSGNIVNNNVIGLDFVGGVDTVFTGNTINGNTDYGIRNPSNTAISNNRVTNSGITDITCVSSTAIISSNVYDTLTGCTVGAYNVKQNGIAH